MIIKDDEALKRLNSPMNLINKLRSSGNGSSRKDSMSLFGIGRSSSKSEVMPSASTINKSDGLPANTGGTHPVENTQPFNPFKPQAPLVVTKPSTTLDNILENNESQIKLGLAHDKALALLNSSVDMLATKLEDVRADRLPSVVAAASKVVESIRKERNEASKNNKDREVHYHFYTPEQKSVSEYEVIDVT